MTLPATATRRLPAIADAPTRALTEAEAARLAELEGIIERSFVEIGLALKEIRDSRLYRATHASFEDYCPDRWGWQASRARQLIGAAETVTKVTAAGLPAPANERQARALVPLKDDERAMLTVWRNAKARAEELGRPLTALMVEEAVRELVAFERRLTLSTTGGGQLVFFGVRGKPTGNVLGWGDDGPGRRPVAPPRPLPFDDIPAALAASERNHRRRAENGLAPMPEGASMIEWRRRFAEGKPDPLERIVARLREERRGRSPRIVAAIEEAIAALKQALDGAREEEP
jgi:hypothetical protein